MNIEMEKPEMKKSHQRMEKRKKIERGKIKELEWDPNNHGPSEYYCWMRSKYPWSLGVLLLNLNGGKGYCRVVFNKRDY
jgi:hypothetical protein